MSNIKPKLNIDEQINHMKNNGITFKIISENEAKAFISNNTYYFKIKSYCKNFDKNSLGQYINLDFAFLNELSLIDMHIRRTILLITLNIEHSIRVNLNYHICQNKSEDGYAIVENFRKLRLVEQKENKYNEDLFSKYKNNFAAWNYLEIITFGELIDFYRYYYDIYDKGYWEKYGYLFCVKQLRNAAAHSNCLICNMRKNNINPNKELKTYLGKQVEFKNVNLDKKMNVAILHDFAAMLYTFNNFIKSDSIIKHTYTELDKLIERIHKNITFFRPHAAILSNLIFFDKMVDFFKKAAYTINIEQKLSP